ncbi:putative replication protein A 32 kDa subunit isoform 2 [Scophthalmus maximus]|uniref:Putative replication protein A 32 kDa subunit isoform 2 n=1 Tax=Scophthalmus maximus TaxID=52904 RepID=A0A2U9AX61_SCOMX|nr:putative replication protein A 32 kDa subunit isoform 2 [Scophthalmus maximus]
MWNQGGYNESSMVGGYTQSPGGFASPAMSQGGEKKGRTRATQIIPCTVSQLMSASQAEEAFRVGDVEVAQVTIVGVIRSTDKSMTNIQYKVDDMTGAPMDVKQWLDTEDPSVDSNVLSPGTYVKVSGNLRSFQAHMVLSKPQTTLGVTGGMSSKVVPISKPGGMGGSYAGANDMANNGLSANQNQVLSLIRSCPEPQGISLQDLKQRLSGISLVIIKQAVEFLSNEGHIFSTIDEDHYKSTDNDD